MSKISITGFNGFVGQNLVSYLTEFNYEVMGVTRENLWTLDENTLSNTSTIIHLAGKAHDLRKTSNADDYYEVNFGITKTLYDYFLKSSAKKFVFVSSVKAVSDRVDGILTEEFDPNPQTHYGKSKLLAEKYIVSQRLLPDKKFYILRPCMIHGPGNKGNLNLLYNFVKKGIPYPLASFKNRRSFLSIENLCFIIKALLEKDVPSGIYNISDDEDLSTTDVVKILSESLNKQPKFWNVPITIVKAIAKIGSLLHLPLNEDRLKKMTDNYVVSNQKIKRHLKLELPVSSRQGLKKTADSFNSNKN